MISPHSIEAEQSVLGAMLMSKVAVDESIVILKSSDFYKESHSKIFHAINTLINNGTPIDTITVIEYLKKKKELKDCGGAYYITGLIETVPTTANIKSYVKIVKDKAVIRKLIIIGHELQESAYKDNVSSEELLNNAESAIFNLSGIGDNTDFTHVHDLMEKSVERLEMISKNGDHVIGIPSGLIDIDAYTLGFQNSDMIVIAGRPSHGKTALSMACVINAAKRNIPVGIFSIEMSNERLADRLLFSESGVNSYYALQGKISKDSWQKINDSAGNIAELSIYINNTVNADVIAMRSQARRLKRKHNIGMLIIDYIQQMYITGTNYTGNQEMTIISRHIKAMAKELDIPVIAISQLSRAVDSRPNKMPMLSDLRESGSIEQDADVVIFLYQPYMYSKDEKDKGIVRGSVAKHRNGKTGQFALSWDENTTTFKNYSTDLPF